MVANVITYRARSVLRDVGKTFGLTQAQVDGLSKYVDSRDPSLLRLEAPLPKGMTSDFIYDICHRLDGFPRHLGSVQMMNWRHFAEGEMLYPGHQRTLGATKPAALAYLEGCHAQAAALLQNCADEVLHQPRPDLNGRPTAAWRFLMATVEHEVHHRSQLATYLKILQIEPPQLYGVHVEALPID